MTTLLLLILITLSALLLNALVLWGITRLFAVESASLPRAMLAVFLMSLAQTGALLGFRALPNPPEVAAALTLQAAQIGLAFIMAWCIIVLVFRIKAGAGALVGLSSMVASGGPGDGDP